MWAHNFNIHTYMYMYMYLYTTYTCERTISTLIEWTNAWKWRIQHHRAKKPAPKVTRTPGHKIPAPGLTQTRCHVRMYRRKAPIPTSDTHTHTVYKLWENIQSMGLRNYNHVIIIRRKFTYTTPWDICSHVQYMYVHTAWRLGMYMYMESISEEFGVPVYTHSQQDIVSHFHSTPLYRQSLAG